MSLGSDKLKEVEGLSDEQITKIAEMSSADEAEVIARKIGETHQRYEDDIESVLGVKKPAGSGRTFEYMKNIISDLNEKAKDYGIIKSKLETSQNELKELQTKLEAGTGDETLKQQITDLTTQNKKLTEDLESQKSAFTEKEKEYNSSLHNVGVKNEIANNLAKLKFVPESQIPEDVKNNYIASVENKILSMTSEFIDGENGKTLVFRDENGDVMLNPKDRSQKVTIGHLLEENLKSIIDINREQKGGGQQGKNGKNSGTLDVSTAKTQKEANAIIVEHLRSEGITKGDEFYEKLTEIGKENNIGALPLT